MLWERSFADRRPFDRRLSARCPACGRWAGSIARVSAEGDGWTSEDQYGRWLSEKPEPEEKAASRVAEDHARGPWLAERCPGRPDDRPYSERVEEYGFHIDGRRFGR